MIHKPNCLYPECYILSSLSVMITYETIQLYGTRSVMFETAYCKSSLKPTGTQHCSPRVSECESLTH